MGNVWSLKNEKGLHTDAVRGTAKNRTEELRMASRRQRRVERDRGEKPPQRRREGQQLRNTRPAKKQRTFGGMMGKFFSLLLICVILLCGVTVGGMFAAQKLNIKLGNATTGSAQLDISQEKQDELFSKQTHERINVLLVGTDKGGSNTDVLMLVSYDVDGGKIHMTSILRDFWAVNDGKGHRVNSCMALGGDELLLETITDLTGVPINYYAKVDTTGFREVVDILGGVDFYVPRDMDYDDPAQGLSIHLKEGMQHLDGAQAEGLVRYRHGNRQANGKMPGYIRGDYERTQVQRDFIKAIIEQKLNVSLIFKAPELYSTITQYVKTNFTATDMMKNVGLLDNMLRLSSEDIVSHEMKAVSATIGGASVQVPDIEYNLELCRLYFGGSGTSDQLDVYKNNFAKYGGHTAVAELQQTETTEEAQTDAAA